MNATRDIVLAPTIAEAARFMKDHDFRLQTHRPVVSTNGDALRGVRGVTVYLVKAHALSGPVLDIVDYLDAMGDIDVKYEASL